MNTIEVTKDFISKFLGDFADNNSKELEIVYNKLINDELRFSSREHALFILNILLTYKWNVFSYNHSDALFYMRLSNYIKHNKEKETIELWQLFRRIDFEITLFLINDEDLIPEQEKVKFVELYCLYFLLSFRHIKCIEKSDNGLKRDFANPTLSFFRASLLDLCFIVNCCSDYIISLENYRQTMVKNINSVNDVHFDCRVVSIILAQNQRNKQSFPYSYIYRLNVATQENYDYAVANLGWSYEKDYYLKNKLFLNPLNSYGNFYESSFEEFVPLDLEQRYVELFDSIVDDYKFCRKKVFEYNTTDTVSEREMCSFYCFMYSIYDKVAYLLKHVYSIDVDEDKVSFSQGMLFDKEYNNSGKKFYEMNNPILVPLYFEMISVRNKNKPEGIYIGTYELNEFRNNVEHKTTLFSGQFLKRNSNELIKEVRNLIIETYLLLSTAKANLQSDKMITVNTAYVSALKTYLENSQ